MRKKLIGLFVVLIVCMLPVIANAEVVKSGECGEEGDNVIWTLDDNGTLTISGTGDMKNYDSWSTAPWSADSPDIKNLIIKKGVTSIGNYAFFQCDYMESAAIPDSVTSIGIAAFDVCFSLTSVDIPASVKSIGHSAFEGCGLEKVSLSYGVHSIGNYAFAYCQNLTSVNIPNSIQYIGERAFFGCFGLTKANIPNSTIFIGSDAFSSCSLSNVNIPAGVEFIGDSAFDGCKNVFVSSGNKYYCDVDGILFTKDKRRIMYYNKDDLNYTIPDGVISIGCVKGLTDVTIPNSVIFIGKNAFDSHLKDIYYEGTEEQWNKIMICSEKSLENVKIHFGTSGGDNRYTPARTDILADGTCKGSLCNSFLTWTLDAGNMLTIRGTGEMGSYDYYQWIVPWRGLQSYIKKIKVSDGITFIGELTFNKCVDATAVEIPKSVTEIGWGAFPDCDSLRDIYYAGTKEQWKSININEENDNLLNATIHYNSTMPEFIPLEVEPVEMTVNEAENKVEFAVTVTDASRAEELNEVELFFAKYDADSHFLGLTLGEKGVIDGNSVTITSDIPDTEHYKFMLWDGNNVPLMPAVDNIKAE